jgi:predicted alpha/beta superfamily hydrolase
MRHLQITSLILFTLLTSYFAMANESAEQYEVLQSKQLNEERRILVTLPDDYLTNTNKKYPVIYLLGAYGDLPMLTGMLGRLQEQDAAPQTIVAMIENTDRTRDLTPTVNQDPRGPVGQGGGGDKYLDFIELELIPHMNKTFRTHDFKIVMGSSIGGLLVIHSLQSRPHLFQAHMAFSPAVWWADRSTVKETKAFITKTQNLDNYLYMNIGEEGGDMRAVYDDLHAFLQNNTPENFTLVTDAFNSVPHGLTAPAGLFNAFHHLFLPMNMPMTAYTGNPESIELYYKRLSLQRGIKTKPPEGSVRQIGYNLVNQQKIPAAINVFKYNIKLHPDSPDAQYGLAYGYEVSGDLQAALAQANKALAVVDESHEYYDFFVNAQKTLSLKAAKQAN